MLDDGNGKRETLGLFDTCPLLARVRNTWHDRLCTRPTMASFAELPNLRRAVSDQATALFFNAYGSNEEALPTPGELPPPSFPKRYQSAPAFLERSENTTTRHLLVRVNAGRLTVAELICPERHGAVVSTDNATTPPQKSRWKPLDFAADPILPVRGGGSPVLGECEELGRSIRTLYGVSPRTEVLEDAVEKAGGDMNLAVELAMQSFSFAEDDTSINYDSDGGMDGWEQYADEFETEYHTKRGETGQTGRRHDHRQQRPKSSKPRPKQKLDQASRQKISARRVSRRERHQKHLTIQKHDFAADPSVPRRGSPVSWAAKDTRRPVRASHGASQQTDVVEDALGYPGGDMKMPYDHAIPFHFFSDDDYGDEFSYDYGDEFSLSGTGEEYSGSDYDWLEDYAEEFEDKYHAKRGQGGRMARRHDQPQRAKMQKIKSFVRKNPNPRDVQKKQERQKKIRGRDTSKKISHRLYMRTLKQINNWEGYKAKRPNRSSARKMHVGRLKQLANERVFVLRRPAPSASSTSPDIVRDRHGFFVGLRVRSRYQNVHMRHYNGTIKQINADGTYNILHADGDRDYNVPRARIADADWLPNDIDVADKFELRSQCPGGHPLDLTFNPPRNLTGDWVCSKCNVMIPRRSRLENGRILNHDTGRCNICQYDLCPSCLTDIVSVAQPRQLTPPPVLYRQRDSWESASLTGRPMTLNELLHELQYRDATPEDYELLMTLHEQDNKPTVVEVEVVEAFGEIVVEDVGTLEGDDRFCVVCQTDYINGDTVRRLPCNHTFHKECIDEWLTTGAASCPIDRKSIGRGDSD